MNEHDRDPLDDRFSLASERTFLACIRTALVPVAGGVGAAKAAEFDHDVSRSGAAGPPLVAGAVLATNAAARWRYETTMEHGGQLPVARGLGAGAIASCVYALVALVAMALDG